MIRATVNLATIWTQSGFPQSSILAPSNGESSQYRLPIIPPQGMIGINNGFLGGTERGSPKYTNHSSTETRGQSTLYRNLTRVPTPDWISSKYIVSNQIS